MPIRPMILTLALLMGAAPVASAVAQTAPAAPAKSGLTRLMEAELARFPSRSGLYIKHLGTGEEVAILGHEPFDSASTIKVPVMVLAYQLADQKKLDLDAPYVVKAADFRGGSGILRHNDFGARLTLRDIITQMIITSDNSATDIMIAKVGGVAKVNEFLAQSGYGELKLNKPTLEYFRWRYEVLDPKYKALSSEDVFALQSNVPYFVEPRTALIKEIREASAARDLPALTAKAGAGQDTWLGVVTPVGMGRMLEGIERGTIASAGACDEMKRMMRAQQAGTRKIPHYLTVPVAHKTGETSGVTNDVGMIYAKSGTIIITSFNMGVAGLAADADDRIGHVARLAVEYFDGAN